MLDQAKPAPRALRRFLRFSVRGLIVLVVMTGAGLSWLVRSAHIQRDAVAAISNAGGDVAYDWDWSNGNSVVGRNAQAQSGLWSSSVSTTSVTSPEFAT